MNEASLVASFQNDQHAHLRCSAKEALFWHRHLQFTFAEVITHCTWLSDDDLHIFARRGRIRSALESVALKHPFLDADFIKCFADYDTPTAIPHALGGQHRRAPPVAVPQQK